MVEKITDQDSETEREANTCIALGAGVGILGATSAVLVGAVCPLCIFVSPGLIGYGVFKKWRFLGAKRKDGKYKKENVEQELKAQ